MDAADYDDLVLGCVEAVPAGRVTTYGAVAALLRAVTGRGGPRQVGRALALARGPVPWWRCVRADGSLPESKGGRAGAAYAREGTALRPDGRVDMARAFVGPTLPG